MEKSIHHNNNNDFSSATSTQQLLDNNDPNNPFSNNGLYNGNMIVAPDQQQQQQRSAKGGNNISWSNDNHVHSDMFTTTAVATAQTHSHQQQPFANIYDQIPTSTFQQAAPQEQFNYNHHRASLPTTMIHHNNDDPFNINVNNMMHTTATSSSTAATSASPYMRRYTEGSIPTKYNTTAAPRKQRMKEKETATNIDPQDEEGKRKHFLERNRQAALKCRQRKKQWLANLQHRVEFLSTDNEQLQSQATMLREEVINLKTLLLAHRDCKVAQANGTTMNMIQSVGNTTVGASLQPTTAYNNNGLMPSSPTSSNNNVQQQAPYSTNNDQHHPQV